MKPPIFTPGVYYKKPLSALAWLQKAFGFEVTLLVQGQAEDERTLHAEMSFNGEGRLIVGGEWAGAALVGPPRADQALNLAGDRVGLFTAVG